jgi:hypothetical protein
MSWLLYLISCYVVAFYLSVFENFIARLEQSHHSYFINKFKTCNVPVISANENTIRIYITVILLLSRMAVFSLLSS